MTTPCDKGPLLNEILHNIHRQGDSLDEIGQTLKAVAVQGERVSALEKKTEDHEGRLRVVEDRPMRKAAKLFKWIGAVSGSVVGAWTIYHLGFGG
jgi:hypothetical protein